MMQTQFTFHGALNYFLPRNQKNTTLTHDFDWRASIKDMIEGIAPPHTEVALIVVNGVSVDFDHIVQDGDVVHVYDDFDAIELENKVRLIPPYPGTPRFILDTHLGRLASYLRMMGFDTLYENDYADDVLAQVSHDEQRILLTRDVGVLKRGIVVYGYYVRETDPRLRLHEINRRYDLIAHHVPFRRCTRCNGALAPIEKAAILDQLEPQTAASFDAFHQCQSCQQIYWRGSHHERMEALIAELRDATA